MKKILLSLSILALVGCSTYRDNMSYTTTPPVVKLDATIQPTIKVGNKVSGRAICSNVLYVFHDAPSEQTYGATINAQTDVLPNSECAAAAVSDALNNSNNADILIAPKFTSITKSFLCLPLVGCFMKTQDVYVDAYEGMVTYK